MPLTKPVASDLCPVLPFLAPAVPARTSAADLPPRQPAESLAATLAYLLGVSRLIDDRGSLSTPLPSPVSSPISSLPLPPPIAVSISPGPISWSTGGLTATVPPMFPSSPSFSPSFPSPLRSLSSSLTPALGRSARTPPTLPSMVDLDSSHPYYDLMYEVVLNRDLYTPEEEDPLVKIYNYPLTIKTALSVTQYQIPKQSGRPSLQIILACAIFHGLDYLELDPITHAMEAFRERLLGDASGWLSRDMLQQFAEWIDDIPGKPESHGDKSIDYQFKLPKHTAKRVNYIASTLGVIPSTVLVACAKMGLACQEHLGKYSKTFSEDAVQFRSMVRVRIAMYEALMRSLELEFGMTR